MRVRGQAWCGVVVQEASKIGLRGRINNPKIFEAKSSRKSIMKELILEERNKKETEIDAQALSWGDQGGQLKLAEGASRVDRSERREITTDLLNFGLDARRGSGHFEPENGDFDQYLEKHKEKTKLGKRRKDTFDDYYHRDRSKSGEAVDRDINLSISSIISGFCK